MTLIDSCCLVEETKSSRGPVSGVYLLTWLFGHFFSRSRPFGLIRILSYCQFSGCAARLAYSNDSNTCLKRFLASTSFLL